MKMNKLKENSICSNECHTSIQGTQITPEIEHKFMNDYMLPDDELVVEFTEALSRFDLVHIQRLLAEDGEFEIIRNEDYANVLKVGKSEYMEWLTEVVKDFQYYNPAIEKLEFGYDRCWGCKLGGYVTLFEDGKFPVELIGHIRSPKVGLLLQANNLSISVISFCSRMQFHYRKSFM